MLLPGLLPIEPLITVAWSLSYEMFYYLCIPLVILTLDLRSRSRRWRVAFFLALAAIMAIYCALFGGHIRLIMFISGILLYEAVESGSAPTPSGLAGLAALILGLLGQLLPMEGPAALTLKVGILFAAFFILCQACFQNPLGWLGRGFSWTPLRWLGNMSYSYYLLHGLSLKAAFMALSLLWPAAHQGAVWFWALLPVMFALSLIPTTALFLMVERPYSLAPRRRT